MRNERTTRIGVAAMFALLGCSASNDPSVGPDPSGNGASGPTTGPSSGAGASGPTSTGSGEQQGWESGSRLRARIQVGTDGSKQFGGWYDSERKENCGSTVASDGKTRCVPAATAGVLFLDADCSQPALVIAPPTCGAVLAKYVYVVTATTPCTTLAMHNVGSKINPAPAKVYVSSGGNCIETVPGANDVYSVGAEVPASSFVEVTEMVE